VSHTPGVSHTPRVSHTPGEYDTDDTRKCYHKVIFWRDHTQLLNLKGIYNKSFTVLHKVLPTNVRSVTMLHSTQCYHFTHSVTMLH